MATTGLAAQAIGSADPRALRAVVVRAGALGLLSGAAIVVLQWLIASFGFRAMAVSGTVAGAGLAYFHVRVWSTPFIFINYSILGWMLGRGEGGIGLFLQAVLNVSNIILCV